MKPAIAWNNFCNEYGDDLCPKKTFKTGFITIVKKFENKRL